VLRQKREIGVGELVLQRLRRRGDGDSLPGQDRRYQICQRLACSRPRLDQQMGAIGDGCGHGLNHLDLPGSLNGIRFGREHVDKTIQRVGSKVVHRRQRYPVGVPPLSLVAGKWDLEPHNRAS